MDKEKAYDEAEKLIVAINELPDDCEIIRFAGGEPVFILLAKDSFDRAFPGRTFGTTQAIGTVRASIERNGVEFATDVAAIPEPPIEDYTTPPIVAEAACSVNAEPCDVVDEVTDQLAEQTGGEK